MARPQPLGIVPTQAFLREVMQSRLMPVTLLGTVGVIGSAVWVGHLAVELIWGGLGSAPGAATLTAAAIACVVTFLEAGLLERLFRTRIRARRRAAAQRARALGEEDLARSLESEAG